MFLDKEQLDLKSCLKFLSQTYVLAKTLSLDIFVGVEIQNQRLWCSNVRQLQDEFMFEGMHFKKKDFWLDNGLFMGNPADAVKVESENSYVSVKTEPDFVSSNLILEGPSKTDNAGQVSTLPLLPLSECPSNHLSNDDNVSQLPSAHESTFHESSSIHNSSMVSLPVANKPTKDRKSEQMTKAVVVLPRLNLTKSKTKRKSCLKFQTDASSETKPEEVIRVDHIRCRHCDEVFKSAKMRLLHYRTVHCICKICGDQFSSVAACRKHEFAHETFKIPPCKKCGKMFTNPSCRDMCSETVQTFIGALMGFQSDPALNAV